MGQGPVVLLLVTSEAWGFLGNRRVLEHSWGVLLSVFCIIELNTSFSLYNFESFRVRNNSFCLASFLLIENIC